MKSQIRNFNKNSLDKKKLILIAIVVLASIAIIAFIIKLAFLIK